MTRTGALPLLLLSIVGCFSPQPPRGDNNQWLQRLQSSQGVLPTEGVLMDIVLLEKPIGDAYFNKDLWGQVDQQVGDLEARAMLEDNGFRFGRLIGQPPGPLQTMLTSERHCVNPTRQWVASGGAHAIPLGNPHAKCEFTLVRAGNQSNVSLESGQPMLVVTPTLLDGGRVKLHFLPRVQYGEELREFELDPGRNGLQMQIKKPRQDYSEMAWDVTLASNEYFLVGCLYDEPQSLGYQAFTRLDGAAPVQRLLVVRVARSNGIDQPSTGGALTRQVIGK